LEKLMIPGTYEYQSEIVRKFRAAGRAEGEARGEAKGRAESVLLFLEARQRVVTDEQRRRILACTELEVLDRWLRKAVVLSSVEELFE
jgi:predicted transposase YdaD